MLFIELFSDTLKCELLYRAAVRFGLDEAFFLKLEWRYSPPILSAVLYSKTDVFSRMGDILL